jgi:hypothetical protein
MTRRAELFDGTVLEFPDTAKDEVIQRVVKEQTQERKAAGADTSASDVGAGLVRSGAKAAAGGFGIGGMAAAGADYLTNRAIEAGQGIADVVTAPYHTVQRLLGNETPESAVPRAPTYESGSRLGDPLQKFQESVADKVAPAPTTPQGRIGEALATGAIEALGGSGLFRVAGQIFKSLPEAAAFFESMAAAPGANAAYSAAASGGGAAAQEAGLPPIVGAIGGLATAAGGHAIGGSARPALAAAKGKFDEKLLRSVDSQEAAAAKQLREAATDPDVVINRLTFGQHPEIVPGSKPTLYEATEDLGIGGAQRRADTANVDLGLEGGGHTYKTAQEARRAEQNAARVDEIRDVGGSGQPADILAEFRRQRTALDQAEEARQGAAQTAADTAAGRAGTAAAPEQIGRDIREPMVASEAAVKAEGNRLYNAIGELGGVTVGTGKMKATVAKQFKDIAESPLSSDERHFANLIKTYDPRVDFQLLQKLRSEIASRSRDFQSPDITRRRFTLLKNAIDEAMDSGLERAVKHPLLKTPINTADPALVERQRAANAHWRDYKLTYGDEPVLARESTRSGFKMDETGIPASAFPPNDKGGARIRAMRAAGAPDDALAEAAALSMQKAAIREGVVNPNLFRQWHRNFGPAIAELPPAVQQRFRSAADAAATLEEVVTARTAAMHDFDLSAVGKVLNIPIQNLEKEIGAHLQSPASAHALANAVAHNPTAQAGLRRLTADHILRRFSDASEKLAPGSLTKWIKDNQAAVGAVFGNDGLKRFQRLSADIERSRKALITGKDPAGPGTAGDMAGLMKPAAGATVMTLLTHAMGPKGAMAAGAVKKILSHMKLAGMADVDALFARALLDPDLARKLLTKAPALKNQKFAKGLGAAILRSSLIGGAYGATP